MNKLALFLMVLLCTLCFIGNASADMEIIEDKYTATIPTVSDKVYWFNTVDENIFWTIKGMSTRNADFNVLVDYKNNKATYTDGAHHNAFQGIEADISYEIMPNILNKIITLNKSDLPTDYVYFTINEVYGTEKDSVNSYRPVGSDEIIPWTDKNLIKEITAAEVFFGTNGMRFIEPYAWDDNGNVISGHFEVKYNSPGSIELFTTFKKEDIDNLSGLIYLDPGIGVWVGNASVVSGLSDIGSYSAPTIFNDSGTWKLIAGEGVGTFNGFYLSGSSWISDPNIIDGLGSVGVNDRARPEVFEMDGTWHLIAGRYCDIWDPGPFVLKGFHWTGSTWASNSSIIGGLSGAACGSPAIFEMGETWYFIHGKAGGSFDGYKWTGSAWASNSSIVSGLTDVGSHARPEVFNDTGTWRLISGNGGGTFVGFEWTGSAWTSDTTLVGGLGDIGSSSYPAVFNNSGTWNLIAGEYDGTFNGFEWNSTKPGTISLSHSTSDFWINYTWTSDGGVDVDSYNVSQNGSWTNDSSNAYMNTEVGPHGFSDITVYGYNATFNTFSTPDTDNNTLPNYLPVLSNATISPPTPGTIHNLTAVNGSVTDGDSDPITFYYKWYKDSVHQSSLDNESVVLSDNTSDNEVWKVGIIPNDGYDNGSEVQSYTVTIGSGNTAPTLTGIESNLTIRKYNYSVLISSVDASDSDGNNYTLHIGTATGLSDLCNGSSTVNGTEANCSFLVPWTSGAHVIYGRLTDQNDTSIEYTEIITVDITPPVYVTSGVSPISITTDETTIITASLTLDNGSFDYVIAKVLDPNLGYTNYTMSGSNGSYSYTFSPGPAGNYRVTTIYAADDSGNIMSPQTVAHNFEVVTGSKGGGGGGAPANVTVIEVGDLTLDPDIRDTYFFYTAFSGEQTGVYKFIANRNLESCKVEPNDDATCEIVDGYIVYVTLVVDENVKTYNGVLTVTDTTDYVASSTLIVRVKNIWSAIPIGKINVGPLSTVATPFFETEGTFLIGIRTLFAGLIGLLFVVAIFMSRRS